MLKCATSLWSADLANLASEMRRVAPFSQRFHIDVADGHYVRNLLFFPDQVRALRPHTTLPFEVHLMATRPLDWVEPFVEAGADVIIFSFDSLKNPVEAIDLVKSMDKEAGVSLLVSESVERVEPFLDRLDVVTLLGTEAGIKGGSMDPKIPEKIRALRSLISKSSAHTIIEADGGIRRETVPLLRAAGADFIVPGSLMFKEDPEKMTAWLASL